jgi:hypothetical protein
VKQIRYFIGFSLLFPSVLGSGGRYLLTLFSFPPFFTKTKQKKKKKKIVFMASVEKEI